MATLASLRSMVYLYLGTQTNDPFYPPTNVDLLINEAYLERAFDLRKENPNFFAISGVLTPTVPLGRSYLLPPGFASYLDVRITSSSGRPLREFSLEDANDNSGADGFTISGVNDGNIILTTLSGVDAGASIYLLLEIRPSILVNDTDVPTLLPSDYHGLLAMDAAFVCYTLGGEQVVPQGFLQIRADKEARFWADVGSRGNASTLTRSGNSQTWPG